MAQILKKMELVKLQLIAVFGLVVLVLHTNTKPHRCKWLSEFLCGDKCLPILNSTCICGTETIHFNDSETYSCCLGPNHSCFQENPMELVVNCSQGKKQVWDRTCSESESCIQLASYGFRTLRCRNESDESQCYMGVTSCRGKPDCQSESDLEICSDIKSERLNCDIEPDHQKCGYLPNAKYQNYGCMHFDSEERPYFECSNRMDKANVLFTRPPVPVKKTLHANNYNQILNYDQDRIFCGHKDILYEDLKDEGIFNGGELCSLKDNKSVNFQNLWIDLRVDFSFEMSSNISEF